MRFSSPLADLSARRSGVWVEVSESLRTGVWPRMDPMFLHYRLTPQAEVLAARRSGNGNAGDLEPITELDVLYGGAEVQAPWGFEKMRTMITGGEDDSGRVDLKTRKGRPGSALAVRKAIVRESAAKLRGGDEKVNDVVLQLFLRRLSFSSPSEESLPSSKSPTSTSAPVLANVATWILLARQSATRSVRTSTRSTGSRRRWRKPSPIWWCSAATSELLVSERRTNRR